MPVFAGAITMISTNQELDMHPTTQQEEVTRYYSNTYSQIP